MADPLQTLSDTLVAFARKHEPAPLNAALLSQSGLTPPENLDDLLKSGFGLSANTDALALTFTESDVQPITNNTLVVNNATIALLGAPQDSSNVTVTFTDDNPAGVTIRTVMSNWSLTDRYTLMTGGDVSVVTFTDPSFVFSAADVASYSWDSNTDIPLQAGQNFVTAMTVPTAVGVIASVLMNMQIQPAKVGYGSIAFDDPDDESIIFPNMNVRLPLMPPQTPPSQLLFLNVTDPQLAFEITTGASAGGDDDAGVEQTPFTAFTVHFAIEASDGKNIELELQAGVFGNDGSASFSLTSQGEEEITPATVGKLVGGDSYFALVPAPLQQFLTLVAFQGLQISATLGETPTFQEIGLSLGSRKGQRLVLLSDGANEGVFAIESFTFDWTILNPQGEKQHLVGFSAEMMIFPTIFKQKDGSDGGIFEISIDQDLNVNGAFTGKVSLDDVLRGVSKGAIGLPNGVQVDFSDVTLALQPSSKTYSFGFITDIVLDFVKWNDQPLISITDAAFQITGTVPPDGGNKTVYQGSIDGNIKVGPVLANVRVEYDGTESPSVWTLHAALAEPLSLRDLVEQFFSKGYELPSFLEITTIDVLSIDATLPSKSPSGGGNALALVNGPQPKYEIEAGVTWMLAGIESQKSASSKISAQLALQYDGERDEGKKFSGAMIGQFTFDAINMDVQIGYRFGYDEDGKPTKDLFVEWEGIRAEYDIFEQQIAFTAGGWTVGRIVQSLVRLVSGDESFELSAPWNVLNSISLDGLQINVDLRKNATQRITASYNLSSPINLGFVTINGLTFKWKNGKILLAISGSSNDSNLQNSGLFDQDGGRDVQDMPSVPGRGNDYFDVKLLALGQHVAIRNPGNFNSTETVIKALAHVPSSEDATNPVDPNSQTDGQPYYSRESGWLAAADIALLKAGDDWTFELMAVFNDPALYGMRIILKGEKAKVLDGLVIDILYKKITDEIGLYQTLFVFPNALRNLDFGTFAITLPEIGVQIYTNGDFLIDFGFPYNMDFSRSFTVQAIIAGVPVVGSAGFYFGKLSNATSTTTPVTKKGTFDPVIVFGLGVQVGLGRSIDKGILKAGISITVFGVIEGTIASWHPFGTQKALPSGGSTALATTTAGSVQGDYYFKLEGTFGVIGVLYGTVDFAIIKASVSLRLEIYAQIGYESFRKIPLSLTGSVSVSVSIEIDCGLFSFSIDFSFSTSLSIELSLGSDSTAPWDDDGMLHAQPRYLLSAGCEHLRFTPFAPSDTLPQITIYATPQFTVLGPQGGKAADQSGAMVLLFAMDAPTTSGGNASGSSFENLCAQLFPWVIQALRTDAPHTDPAYIASQTITKDDLKVLARKLANVADPPIKAQEIENFLETAFSSVNVVPVSSDDQTVLGAGATVFPAFRGFTFSVPAAGGGTANVKLDEYTSANGTYRDAVAQLLRDLEARVAEENKPQLHAAADPSAESMARFVFEDYFLLIARQLVGAAIDAMGDYRYQLTISNGKSVESIDDVVKWAAARGNTIAVMDVAAPNADHELTLGTPLSIIGLSTTVQNSDTLTTIARRYSDSSASPAWGCQPADVIVASKMQRQLLRAGIQISAVASTQPPHTTLPGDTFQMVADALKIPVETLAQEKALWTRTDLLHPGGTAVIPTLTYPAGQADTLNAVCARFSIPLATLAGANQTVKSIFDGSAPAISIANLDSLYVSDVWSVLQAQQTVANTAAMVSRYHLHGLRMPNLSGLTLSNDFLYERNLSDYGIYQLIGQQVPVVNLNSTNYPVTIAKDTSLNWLAFSGSTGQSSIQMDLGDRVARLGVVVDYAKSSAFTLTTSTLALDAAHIVPKRFAVGTGTLWTTSALKELLAVTAPIPSIHDNVARAGGPQVDAILWDLPANVLRVAEERHAALAAVLPKASAQMEYLPLLQPQIATTDPATSETVYSALDSYTFATRIDFQVKRLAQTDGSAPERANRSNVTPPDQGNPGPPPSLAPYNYEIVAPSPPTAALLAHLLAAMDSLGDHIISGLFVTLHNAPNAGAGINGRGAQEYLTFITQTNLSTQTNPPMSGALTQVKGTSGIANTPAEFLKLLWELATVRSGGYYLYYQTLEDGMGIPSDLFDQNGIATLSAVVTYTRPPGSVGAGRLTNFVNALLTTQAIDRKRSIVSLQSQSSAGKATPPAQALTLGDLARVYGMSLSALANANGSALLPIGAEMPVQGLYRVLTPADMTADPYATLAQYYSRGAKAPLTAAGIAQWNTGVVPNPGVLVRIPPFTYVVSTDANGPGASFASIALYYRTGIDAVGTMAETISSPFGTSAFNVDSLMTDVSNALGFTNVGFRLSRPRADKPPFYPQPPSEWTQQQKTEYASDYLATLYTMLTPGLIENAFISESPYGLACGPQREHDQRERMAMRDPQIRRALLASEAVEPMNYRGALSVAKYAKVNPCPEPADQWLPRKEDNPYIGIGTYAQIDLAWVDVFGNRNPALAAPQPVAEPMFFVDAPIGISQWPNVQTSYIYDNKEQIVGKAQLNIDFALRTDAYDAKTPKWQQNAINDLQAFTRIYYQLEQNYDLIQPAIPGLSGHAIDFSLTNTLFGDADQPLAQGLSEQLRTFVRQCVEYVAKRAQAQDGGEPPATTLHITVDTHLTVPEDIVNLDVRLTLTRQAQLTHPLLRGPSGALRAESSIHPKFDGKNAGLDVFAKAFEEVFTTAGYDMRLGTSAPPADQPRSTAPLLWAVRFAKSPKDSGIGFEIDPHANFYAPKPVANAVRSGSADIPQYQTGEKLPDSGPTMTFSAIDMNVWAQSAFSAIDAFLTATYAAPAYIVDYIDHAARADQDGLVRSILNAKEKLADAVSRTTSPILKDTSTEKHIVDGAKEQLRQSLLMQLGNAYSITAVTAFDVKGARYRGSDRGVVPPRLYGQPVATGSAASRNKTYSLSSGRIPLNDMRLTPEPITMPDSQLAFTFNSKNATAEPYVTLPLAYNITHVEHSIQNLPGIQNYEQSSWITLVRGPIVRALGTEPVTFPVVIRTLPAPPVLGTQTATGTNQLGNADHLARWTYAYTFTGSKVAQDTASATVRYGIPASKRFFTDPQAALFRALARFVTVFPAISKDFEAFVRPLSAQTDPKSDAVKNARAAVAAFETLTWEAANAYDLFADAAMLGDTPPPAAVTATYEFRQHKDADETTGIIDVFLTAIDPPQAKPPVPLVDVVADGVSRKDAPLHPGAIASYRYKRSGGYLSYNNLLDNAQRSVSASGLDVFAIQNALVTVRTKRNSFLANDALHTTETFQFVTPDVTFAKPIIPILRHRDFSLGKVTPATLEGALSAFFTDLFSSGGGNEVKIKMESAFSFALDGSVARTVIPINLLPPFEASATGAPPFVSALAAHVADWLHQNSPALDASSQLQFALSVFALGDADMTMPIFELDNLYGALAN